MVLDERGAEAVERLAEDSVLSAVNWAEIWQVARERAVVVAELRSRVEACGVSIVPFDSTDAERTGDLHGSTRAAGLSPADRACLALAARLGVPAVTADRAWAELDVGVEIVCIR